jgi:DNA transposition AAA+ family ATPase
MQERSLTQQERILSQEKGLTCFEGRDETLPVTSFGQTKPYQSFVECCDTCRRFRYVAICYGPAGVGKTLAARWYANWDAIEPLLMRRGVRMPVDGEARPYPRVGLYTPGRTIRPKQIENDVALLMWSLENLEKVSLTQHLEAHLSGETRVSEGLELLIIDNVHRLDVLSMDVVQDIYDRYRIGVVLLGSEVLKEKHLARLEHLRVRVGDVRPFGVLSRKEVFEMIPHVLSGLNMDFQAEQGLTLSQLTDDIHHATNGNLSLIRHFLTQIVIVLQEKKTAVITSDIVQKAYAKLMMQ